MAKPRRTRIDYFPIDCSDDDRLKLIELKHGLVAYAVYVKLLQKIYGNKGYYMEWNEDNALLFSGEYGLDIKSLSTMIEEMLKRGIFHKQMYEKHSILTSKDIQEQYFFVIAKRRIREVNEHYCLINVTKTGVNVTKEGLIVCNKPHSIVEDSITKDSIEEGEKKEEEAYAHTHEKARGEFKNVILTEAEYEELQSKYQNIDNTVERLSQYMAATGKSYASHYAVLKKWAAEDKPPEKKEENSSYDIDDFFQSSLRRTYGDDITKYLTG